MKHSKSPRSPLIRALEPRILFDGAAIGSAAEAATEQAFTDSSAEQAKGGNVDTPPATRSPLSRALDAAREARENDRSSAVFIDQGVDNHETLAEAARSTKGADVHVIGADEDGLARVADVLNGGNYESAHILGHGDSAQMSLGASSLSRDNMDVHAGRLSSIGESLGPDGDLLLYGCEVAEGQAGRDFVNDLSAAAGGIDVAASDDSTGASEFGGNWALEVTTGEIQDSALNVDAFGGLLAPPEVTVPEDALSASEDTDLVINDVSVGDADGDNLDVTLEVGDGTLTLAQTTNVTVSGDGSGSVSVSGSAADINSALAGMTYRGDTDFNGSDALTIGVNDGESTTNKSVGIEVAAVNDSPTLSPGNPSADEGGTTTLTEADFGVSDPDLDPSNTNPQLAKQLVFKLDGSTLPSEGALKLNGSTLLAGSTFSLQDVRDGNLEYSHGGSQVAPGDTDAFSLTINDGGGSGDVGPTTIEVNLQPVNDAPSIGGSPEVFEGQGTEAEFGNPSTTTEAADIGGSLDITDPDDTVADSQVTITNIVDAGEGTLFRDTNGNGKLDSGEVLTGGETFAASELAAGRLRFAHSGDEVDGTNPSFDIEVTDEGGGAGEANAESSGPQTIDIQVKPNNDNPELANNSPVTVDAGGDDIVPISSGELNSTDVDSAANRVVYTVTDVPTRGELRLDDQILGVGGRFTQADINAGRVDYRQTDSFSDGDTDTFDFEVRDSTQKAFNESGKDGAVRNPDGSVKQNTFTINFSGDESGGTGPGDPDPSLVGPIAVGSETVNGLTGDDGTAVEEDDGLDGGDDTRTITDSELAFELRTAGGGENSIAVPAEETIYRLTQLPGNGTLQLDGTDLGLFDTFTQQDINDGKLSFFHDGSENHQDSFGFSVSAGTNDTFERTFALEATPTNDAPKVNASDLPLLPEGGTTRITDAQIALNDVDVDNEPGENGGVNDPNGQAVADDLMFRITDLPTNGLLERFDGSDWVSVTTDELLSADLLTASADGGDGGLRYTHDGTENYADSFSVEVRDDLASNGTFGVRSQTDQGAATGDNVSGNPTVNITMAPQNDAPILPQDSSDADTTITDKNGDEQTTANSPLKMAEGGTSVIDENLLKSVDSDNTDPDVLQYRITQAPENGFLALNGSLLGNGSTFTQADINSGQVSYEHDGSEAFADQFKFEVSDSVNSHVYSEGGAGGESTFDINITQRNDVPELDAPDSLDAFASGNNTTAIPGITLDDLDLDDGIGTGETDFIRVELSVLDNAGDPVTAAQLNYSATDPSGGSAFVSGKGTESVIVQGTKSEVDAVLGSLTVAFSADADADDHKIRVTADDRLYDSSGDLTSGANGGTASDNADGTPINAANNRVTQDITLRASNDNDAPTITNGTTYSVNEDNQVTLNGFILTDADSFGEDVTATVKLYNDSGRTTLADANTEGSLRLGDTTGLTSSSGDDSNTITLTGTMSDVQAALNDLQFEGADDYNGPGTGTGELFLQTSFADFGHADGQKTDTVDNSIEITPVNDQPTLSVPADQTLDSGTSIAISGFTVADTADTDQGASDFITVEVAAILDGSPEGTINLTASGATVSNNDSATVTVEGTAADVQAALDSMNYTPSQANADKTILITVTADDRDPAGTGDGNGTEGVGVDGNNTVSDTFNINVSDNNEGPSVNGLSNQSVDEDASLIFSSGNGNAFSVSDPDDFGADMEATVSVDHGTVTAAGGSGATLAGDGSATLTITGSESEINAALDGLVYTSDADFHTDGAADPDTITVTIDDQGNTGSGGALNASQSATIGVDPVNDRPDASEGPETVAATVEHQTGTPETLSSLLGGNYDDSTDDQTTDGGGDTSTVFSFVAITGSTDYDAAQGTWQVSDGSGWIDVPASGLDASNALVVDASREIRFDPAPDFHGTPGTLDVRLADGDPIDTISESAGAGDLKDLSSEGGTGETGRWSADSVTIETNITNENDPPSATGDATLPAVDEDATDPTGDTVTNLFGGVFDDSTDDQSGITGGGDASTSLGGIAIVGNAADAGSEGTWQYSTDNGTSWTGIPEGSADDTSAIILPNDARLRFVPVGDYNGTPGGLDVRLADATQTLNGSRDISTEVGDDTSRDTDIWSGVLNLDTSVNAVDDGVADSFTTQEDTALNDDVSTNDTHDATATYTLNTDAANGTVSMDGDGTFTYTPDADYNGSDSFTYDVEDVNGDTETVTVDLTVNPVADIADDTASTDEDTSVTTDVLANDDFEGTPSVTGVTQGANGTVTNNNDGTVTYTPDADFNGSDSYTYTVTSGGVTETATVDVTVNPVNDAPTGVDDSIPVTEDTPVTQNVLGNDTDPEGDPLTISSAEIDTDGDGTPDALSLGTPTAITDGAGNPIGSVTVESNGDVTFDPAQDYTGAVPDLGYTPNDGTDNGTPATVNMGPVSPVNDAPIATDEGPVSVTEDTPASGNVLANDSDPDSGDTLEVTEFTIDGTSYSPGDTATLSGIGTLVIDSGGSYTFTPDPDYNGPVPTASYTVSDNNGGTDTADLSFSEVSAVADIADDTASTDEDTSVTTDVLANDDFEGTPSVTGVTQGANGTVTNNNDGTVTYTPDADFNGSDSYTYTVTSGGVTETATVDVTVNPVNDAPTGVDDSIPVTEDTPVTQNVLGNDTDPEGDPLTISSAEIDTDGDGTPDALSLGTPTAITDGAGNPIGSVTVESNGDVTFDPAQDYTGAVPDLGYTPNDGTDNGTPATVNMGPVMANDAPVAVDDTFTVAEEGSTSIDVLGNDSDADGDTLGITSIDGQTVTVGTPITLADGSGTATLETDGTITFNAATDYNGPATFDYEISDGTKTSAATVTGSVTGVNDPPVGVDDTIPVNGDTPVTQNVLGNDTDAEGDPLTISSAEIDTDGDGTPEPITLGTSTAITDSSGNPIGSVTVDSNGDVTFDPAESYTGTVPDLVYTPTDGTDDGTSATVVIGPVNGGPAQPGPGDDDPPIAAPPATTPANPAEPGGSGQSAGEADGVAGITQAPDGETDADAGNDELGTEPFLFTDWVTPELTGFAEGAEPTMGQVRYQATQADGSPLPEGLTVDPDTGEIKGSLPPGTERAQIRVIGVDEDGNTQTREVVVDQQGNVIDPRETDELSAGSGYHRMEVSVGTDGRVTVDSGRESTNAMFAESFSIASGQVDIAIADSKAAEVTRYMGRLSDGGPLPQGIDVDPSNGRVTGSVPPDTDSLSIQVIAVQPDGENRTLQIDLNFDQQSSDSTDWQSLEQQVQSALATMGDSFEAPHGDRMLAALGISR